MKIGVKVIILIILMAMIALPIFSGFSQPPQNLSPAEIGSFVKALGAYWYDVLRVVSGN